MTSLPNDAERRRALRGLRIYFAHRRWPRLMMTSIVLLSGGAGLLSSFWMLRAGLTAMWLRYPVAVIFAWAAFLALIRAWVEVERRYLPDKDLEEFLHLPDPGEAETLKPDSSWFDWIELPLEAEEGCLIQVCLIAIVILLAFAFFGIVSVVVSAPALVAEVSLDAVLVAALYRRMKLIEHRWWLGGAIRQTWGPVLLTAFALMIAGFAMQAAEPRAVSIGDVWWHSRGGDEAVEREAAAGSEK